MERPQHESARMALSSGVGQLSTVGVEHGETEICLGLDFELQRKKFAAYIDGKVRGKSLCFVPSYHVQFEGKITILSEVWPTGLVLLYRRVSVTSHVPSTFVPEPIVSGGEEGRARAS